jgi:hypothetical protein
MLINYTLHGMVLCIAYGKPDIVTATARYEAGSNPVYAHGLLHCVRKDGGCCRYRLYEVRSNPVYTHGLLHSVRKDGGCCRHRHCEVRSNPVYAYGLLHSVRNDGVCRHCEGLRGTKQRRGRPQ